MDTNDNINDSTTVIINKIPSSFFENIEQRNKNKKQTKKYLIILLIAITFLFIVRIPLGIVINTTLIFGIPIPTMFLQLFDELVLIAPQLIFVFFIILVFIKIFPNEKSLAVGLAILSIFVFMGLFASFISPYDPTLRNTNCSIPNCAKAPPSLDHIMGTTTLGYDVYSRIIYGAQIPLQISIITVLICFSVGVPLGLISAYYGGYFDRVLNSVMDLLYSFPALLLAITLSIFLTDVPFIGGSNNLRIILVVAFSNGLVYIPTLFRITRGKVFQLKEAPYIEAVKTIGASNSLIMLRYVLPNVISAPITIIPFDMTDAILTEAALAFLGIGILPPTHDWGYDLTAAQNLTQYQPWLIFFPGLMIFFLAFAFSLLGDALNDKFNPLISKEL